jgi:hypothetical protein
MSRVLPEWLSGRRATRGFLTGWEEVIFELADAEDDDGGSCDLIADVIRSGQALLTREE